MLAAALALRLPVQASPTPLSRFFVQNKLHCREGGGGDAVKAPAVLQGLFVLLFRRYKG